VRGKEARAAANRRANAESERISELQGEIAALKEQLRREREQHEHEISHQVRDQVTTAKRAFDDEMAETKERLTRRLQEAEEKLPRFARIFMSGYRDEQRDSEGQPTWSPGDWSEMAEMLGERMGEFWELTGGEKENRRTRRISTHRLKHTITEEAQGVYRRLSVADRYRASRAILAGKHVKIDDVERGIIPDAAEPEEAVNG